MTADDLKTARYITSARKAENLSYQFIGVDGNRLDLGNSEILKKVFPVRAKLDARINNFGNLSLDGKDLWYEVRLVPFPASKENVVCEPNEFCSTGLLHGYQFSVSYEKFSERKITLIFHDIKNHKEIGRLDLQRNQAGYFAFPDGSQVVFTPKFDPTRIGVVEVEFTLT